jgi:hypothetical protein
MKTVKRIFTEEVTRQQLIDNFLELKRELGRQPNSMDMDVYSSFSVHYYYKEFGNWTKFLQSQGIEPLTRRAPSREELIQEFLDVQRILGHPPSGGEISAHGKYAKGSYIHVFGSWKEFLSTQGLEPIVSYRIPDEELDADYDKVKMLLGKIPKRKDMMLHGKYSINVFEYRFGTFGDYLDYRGEQKMRL